MRQSNPLTKSIESLGSMVHTLFGKEASSPEENKRIGLVTIAVAGFIVASTVGAALTDTFDPANPDQHQLDDDTN